MLDNYPPGFDPKSLDDPYSELAEYIRDNTEVRYELKVFVDDEQVFASDYPDDESLQEELRKPERAVDAWFQKEIDYRWDEANEPPEYD